MPLLVATNNAGKLREIRFLLPQVEIFAPADLDLHLEVEESGSSFAENAALKAHAFARASGLIALADDSGLEVETLHGAPGVLSARYGGPGLDDGARCRLLLEKMRPFSLPEQRRARFRCHVVAAAPDGRACQAEGTCQGIIAQEPAGDQGFGYDPLFLVAGRGKTMAQLPLEIKNQLSHRARAFKAIRPLLRETFPELKS